MHLEFGVDRQMLDDLELRLLVNSTSNHVNIVHVGRRLQEPYPVTMTNLSLLDLQHLVKTAVPSSHLQLHQSQRKLRQSMIVADCYINDSNNK